MTEKTEKLYFPGSLKSTTAKKGITNEERKWLKDKGDRGWAQQKKEKKTDGNPLIGQTWKRINIQDQEEIDKNGYKLFRENIAKHYMTANTGEKGTHIFLNDENGIEQLYNLLLKNDIEVDISDTILGGGFYVEMFNKTVTMDLLISLWEINLMQKAVDFNKIESVTEIGAGYGRTLYAILKKYPHIKCNIIDIEPALSVSKYYLNETLPDANINWYTQEELNKMKNTDLVFCISAFCEMPMIAVEAYFDYADKYSKYFYFKHDRHCNHFPERYRSHYPIDSRWSRVFSKNCVITPRFYEELYIMRKKYVL